MRRWITEAPIPTETSLCTKPLRVISASGGDSGTASSIAGKPANRNTGMLIPIHPGAGEACRCVSRNAKNRKKRKLAPDIALHAHQLLFPNCLLVHRG